MTTHQSIYNLSGQPVAGTTPYVWQILQSALELQLKGAAMDTALKLAMAKGPRLEPSERHTAVGELDAINRHRARLAWALAQEHAQVSPANLAFAWAALAHGRSPEHLRTITPVGRADASLIARIGRRRLDDEDSPEIVRLECPPAFEASLRSALGERFTAELRASLVRPPTDLRVNTLKASVADVAEQLHKEKIEAQLTQWSPWGLRCAADAKVSATRVFSDGLVEFQDEGSQLVALLVDARPEHQVLDYCAGAGGKTLALAAAMQNKGHLVAADTNSDRLTRAKQRLRRGGVENAERLIIDNNWAKRHKLRFDRVLVDAPCSGTGSWRRNPDARWSLAAAKLDELAALQDQILDRAAPFVKPGGRLIYATCSLLPVENDQRITAFLDRHKDFALTDARDLWATLRAGVRPPSDDQFLRLSPAIHGTDGFFAAVLTRARQP
jgi:16S rRNA (cytosine967-C5)-methyltransferase